MRHLIRASLNQTVCMALQASEAHLAITIFIRLVCTNTHDSEAIKFLKQ